MGVTKRTRGSRSRLRTSGRCCSQLGFSVAFFQPLACVSSYCVLRSSVFCAGRSRVVEVSRSSGGEAKGDGTTTLGSSAFDVCSSYVDFSSKLGPRTVREPSASTTALDTVCSTSRVRSCSAQRAGWRCGARVARCSASGLDAWQIARGVRITFGRRTAVSAHPDEGLHPFRTDAPVRKRYDRGHKRGLDDVAGDQHALKFLQYAKFARTSYSPMCARLKWWRDRCAARQSLQCNSRLVNGRYRSAAAYFQVIKRMHVASGHKWTQQHVLLAKDAERAAKRGQGPARQAQPLLVEEIVRAEASIMARVGWPRAPVLSSSSPSLGSYESSRQVLQWSRM